MRLRLASAARADWSWPFRPCVLCGQVGPAGLCFFFKSFSFLFSSLILFYKMFLDSKMNQMNFCEFFKS
jgi:hypothetical protein